MCEEIELCRHDETPWGFRLTGGHDFGIPLTVVRVTGGSLAEEAGMCVGDMIVEINGDSTAQITHSEAQQCILEAGNHITLSILRGSPVPAITPTRGLHTPSFVDRATSSVGSVTEYESMHSGTYRDNVVSAVSESNESGHEMTEEEIAEKLLESAEVIENNGKNVIGVNFKRFVPKCDFIKNSLVFQTLQEEQIFDQKSEQDQLKKCPTKRFSTFLTTPNRPKIKPPEKKKAEEVQVKESAECKQNEDENIEVETRKQVCTSCKCKLRDIEDFVDSTNAVAVEKDNTDVIEDQDKDNSENVNEIKNEEEEEPKETDPLEEVDNNTITEELIIEETEKSQESDEIVVSKKEPANEFEKNIADIQNQIAAIRELPQQIENHITLLEKRLSELLSHKVLSEETTETGRGTISDEEDGRQEGYEESKLEFEVEGDSEEPYNKDVYEAAANHETADTKDAQQMEPDKKPEVECDQQTEETSCSRPMYPLTPLPRPIVLPGGRKWRSPKDAYNEKFIAETLISQAEVLVGSTLGVNFRKYEPPKFDLSNSAVYKLVHNIESKNTGGIENRPEIIAAEEDFYYHKPIDARQFYLATLSQPSIVPDFENDNHIEH